MCSQRSAGSMGCIGHGRDIDDLEVRIGRAFDPYHSGGMTRDSFQGRRIREVHVADFHTKLGKYLGKEPEGAAVDIFLGKNHISTLES